MQDSVYTPAARPIEPRPISQKKVCKGCGKEKPLYDFKEDRRMPDGKWHTCSACLAEKERTREQEPFEQPVAAAAPVVVAESGAEVEVEAPEPQLEEDEQAVPAPADPVEAMHQGLDERYVEDIPAERAFEKLDLGAEGLPIGWGLGARSYPMETDRGKNPRLVVLGAAEPSSYDQEQITALQAKITRLHKAERKIRRELKYARLELENCELQVRLDALERRLKGGEP